MPIPSREKQPHERDEDYHYKKWTKPKKKCLQPVIKEY